MTERRNPKDSERMIKTFAWKVLRRLHAAGARTYTLEDVMQELWLAWCVACESYDPDQGTKFSTFLYGGMKLHINRFIERHVERFHGQTIALSFEHAIKLPDGGAGTLADVVPNIQESALMVLERESNYKYALKRLSPEAGQFLRLLHDQPPEILEALLFLGEKAEFARSKGVYYAQPNHIARWMIFDLMGSSRIERSKIMREVEDIAKLISER